MQINVRLDGTSFYAIRHIPLGAKGECIGMPLTPAPCVSHSLCTTLHNFVHLWRFVVGRLKHTSKGTSKRRYCSANLGYRAIVALSTLQPAGNTPTRVKSLQHASYSMRLGQEVLHNSCIRLMHGKRKIHLLTEPKYRFEYCYTRR